MAEVVVVHGYAGSGKTTQCGRIAEEGLGTTTVRHISIGNRLRAIRTEAVASRFSDAISSPNLPSPPPDDIINGVVFDAIAEPPARDMILLDGYPRYPQTVELFHDSLQANSHELLGTVFFWISQETSIERALARGQRQGDRIKHSDLLDHITYRYRHDAQTVHRATRALGAIALVEHIDASGDKEDVHARFRTALGKLALKNEQLRV